jgi:hypothetical protein
VGSLFFHQSVEIPKMRPIPFLAAHGALSVILSITWGFPGSSVGRADLRFHHPVADLGEVKASVPLSYQFGFVNEGREPVQIIETRPNCGCIVHDWNKGTFLPGEHGILTLDIRTIGEPSGMHQWKLQVVYKTGNAVRETQLLLTAKILTEIFVQPPAMTVYADRTVAHEILVTDFRPKTLSISNVLSSSSFLKCQVGDVFRDNAGHLVRQIKLEITNEFSEGRHLESVVIQTDDPLYRELKVPVTVVKQSRQRVTAHPMEVALEIQPDQPIPSKVILLRDRENQGVSIEEVIPDKPALICKWVPGPGTHATVKITMDKTKIPAGGFQSSVRIQLTRPAPEILIVPVTCTVQK